MKLRDRLQRAFNMLEAGEVVSLRTLAKHCGGTHASWPNRMRALRRQVAPYGWAVKRVSPLGRNGRGEYQMTRIVGIVEENNVPAVETVDQEEHDAIATEVSDGGVEEHREAHGEG